MIKAVFYIPQFFNTGEPIPVSLMQRLQEELLVQFGGFTLSDPVQGAWVDDEGQVYRDTSLKFEVALEPAQVPQLRDYLRSLKEPLGQKALYLEVQDAVRIEFL